MASAAPDTDFESWLSSKLVGLNADVEVYAPYLTGILEDDEEEDKAAAVEGILAGFMEDEDEMNRFRDELIAEWDKSKKKASEAEESEKSKKSENDDKVMDLSAKLASITASQTADYEAKKAKAAAGGQPDANVKAAILAQYSNVVEGQGYELVIKG